MTDKVRAARTTAVFPDARRRSGMYESFYMRAVAPDRPLGAWIRHTVHKPPGRAPRGSVWCTVFDSSRGAPLMHKLTTDAVRAPADAWIEVGEREGQGASIAPASVSGSCGGASWVLEVARAAPELRHLPSSLLYRAPLPRTKLTSAMPAARFSGTLAVPGREAVEVREWSGMIGHNWGSQHAERWIWLHGVDFIEERDAWLDVALGRVLIGGRMTPWLASGALSVGGRRVRIGGLRARVQHVRETPGGCELRLGAKGGARVDVNVTVPPGAAAGWRYADPDGGGGHDVVNCSIAQMSVSIAARAGAPSRSLESAYGGAYELGMRERDHGVAIAPFEDG